MASDQFGVPTSDVPSVPGCETKWGVVYNSPMGADQGAPAERFVFYGHAGETMASLFAAISTLNTIHVTSLSSLESFLNSNNIVGLAAHSRMEHAGEAGQAISVLRQSNQERALALYGAWDYNVARGAKRAIEYRAHGVTMPAAQLNETVAYVFNMMSLVSKGLTIPTSVEMHEKLLKAFYPKSPFWTMQDFIVSEYF